MAEIQLSKLKVRRGTDAQRKTTILDQGELGYTTDTKRLFVGDGYLSGGYVTANVIHPPIYVNGNRQYQTNAVKGDIINENGFLYQLSGSDYSQLTSWGFIGTIPDNSSLEYNASRQLKIKDNGISGNSFASSAAYSQGGLVATSSNGLSANVDNSTLIISTATNQLSVFNIDENQISSTSFGNGISGGSGDKITLNISSDFTFDTGKLKLNSIPSGLTAPSNFVVADSIDSTAIGGGLSLSSGVLVSNLRTVDSSFTVTAGQISLANTVTSGTAKFSNITYNSKGQITSTSNTITDSFSGNETSDTFLSAFNGDINQTVYSNQTLYTAISTNSIGTTASIELSSAGFIVLDTALGSFAVPVFKF